MNKKDVDLVLINPGDRKEIFQALGAGLAAVEPPFWIAVIAAYLQKQGVGVNIIDANAENISPMEVAKIVVNLNPHLVCLIVYGSQPSASTQNMPSTEKICTSIKEISNIPIAVGGLHPSALPAKTIAHPAIDFVLEGEGIYTLELLLKALYLSKADANKKFPQINGLWWKDNKDKKENIFHTPRFEIIKNIDDVLPVAAWDLLPMEKYRAHNWHCFDNINDRSPYAAIYTSLGCPFNCVFCCINAPFGRPSIRYRNPQIV